MIRKTVSILLLGILIFVLAACSDPVADELVDYYNQDVQEFGRLMIKIKEPNNKLHELKEEENKQEAYHLVQNELLPLITDIHDYVRSVQLQTDEVIELHNYLIESTELLLTQYEGLNEFIKEEEEYSEEIKNKKIDESNQREKKMKQLTDTFEEELEKLMDQHNLEWE